MPETPFSQNPVADATLAYHKKGSIEYIPFPDKLKGRYQAFTQADPEFSCYLLRAPIQPGHILRYAFGNGFERFVIARFHPGGSD
jgi:hypothetical protein